MTVSLFLVLLLGSFNFAQAATFIGPRPEDANVTVSSDQEHRNLYVAGGNVLVNSQTLGDLYVAGGNVTVEGDVEQDLVALGGSVYLNGAVGGDLRVAGGNITINDNVAGDLIVLSGTVIVSEKASIGGDVVALGGEVNMNAPVAGSLTAYADRIAVNNRIEKQSKIDATQQVSFGEKAVFGAGVVYKAPREAEITNRSQLGDVRYEQRTNNRQGRTMTAFAGIASLGYVVKILAMILAALALWKLFPRTTDKLITNTHNRFWMNMLVGFLFIVVGPIALAILLLVMIGFYAAIILFVFWLLVIIVGALLAQVYVGSWLVRYFNKRPELVVDWQAVVIGVVVLSLISLVPAIGWLIMALLLFAAIGGMLRALQGQIRSEQNAPGPVEL